MKEKHYEQIVIYQSKSKDVELDVRVSNETVWLTQAQMTNLFGRDRTVITRHINNIFREGELVEKSNVQNMHIPNSDKPVKTYNLDVVISVGYRVKSLEGTRFRQWANNVLKEHILNGYAALPDTFIVNTVRAALDFEGISDLMKLWENEKDKKERGEIIADIQDMLDACNQTGKADEIYVKFNDLDAIAHNIRAFKDSLLQVVTEHGGIGHLAELTGIPQPSLSRFFNSNAMPHRTTLLKIAKALELDEIKIELSWTK